MNKMDDYFELLNMNYESAVSFLLDKYGPATDDYFKEKSYERFLKGEIKSISRGNTSRTLEGLYCHHINENKYLKMADVNYIKRQKIPFSLQTKDKLVYCDLIEHAILHTIISRETKNSYGRPGLDTYLIPNIIDWYIEGNVPTQQWQLNCYKKSFLEVDQAKTILKAIKKAQGNNIIRKDSSKGFFAAIANFLKDI